MTEKPSCPFDITHMCEILTLILEKGEIKASDVKSDASWRTLDSRFRWLVDDGLLCVSYPKSGRKTPRYSLTPKGKAVAYIMCLGQSVYNGEVDFENNEVLEKIEDQVLSTSMKHIVDNG